MGRPRTGLRKISISVSVDRELSDWLDTKDSRTDVVNTAVRKLMEYERRNELPFLREELQKKIINKNDLEVDIKFISEKISKLTEEEKALQKSIEKKEDEKIEEILETKGGE